MAFEIRKLIREALIQVRSKFNGTDEEFEKIIDSKFPELMKGTANILRGGLIKLYKEKILDEIRTSENRFNQNLFSTYQDGLDGFQIFIDLNKYLGRETAEKLLRVEFLKGQLRIPLLVSLHARV